MTVFALLVLAIMIIGITLFHMAREGGKKAEQQKQQVEVQKQQVEVAKRDIETKKVVIELEAAPIKKIKEVMSKKYTRD